MDEALLAHERLCQAGTCGADDLKILDEAAAFLASCHAQRQEAAAQQVETQDRAVPKGGRRARQAKAKPKRWIFPVAGMKPELSMGGPEGRGYLKNRRVTCYASERAGHPAHDLFIHDVRQSTLGADGYPFEALSVEPGIVLAARSGWTPEDPGRGGNYVLVYLPLRRWVAYYAHLDRLAVAPGDVLEAGAPLGTVGRTGVNAWQKRSPTHLPFAVWDTAHGWKPVDPYELLRGARVARRAAASSASPSKDSLAKDGPAGPSSP